MAQYVIITGTLICQENKKNRNINISFIFLQNINISFKNAMLPHLSSTYVVKTTPFRVRLD